MDLEQIRKNENGMILQFAIPSIIAMVLTAMITVVDGFFVGNYVGKEGMAAVNLGLPIVYLFLAVGLMIAVGGMAIAGRKLGAGEIKMCNDVFNQTMLTTVLISVLLSVIVFLGFEPFLYILHAKGQVVVYFKEYYTILLFELPIMVINSSFGMFIRGEGNPQYFMKVNIITVLLNVILDYIFAAKLGMGVSGIAAASLLAAIVTFVVTIYFFAKKSKVYKIQKFVYRNEVLKEILLNGSSEFIGEMSMCISMFAYNFVIMRQIGVDGVTAFTIVGYISYVFSMIVIGFGQGASPLISFTYGANDVVLAKEIRKRTNLFVFGVGVLTIVILLFGMGWYSTLFVKSEIVQEMVCAGIKIYMISFLISGINVITSFYFTSIGKAKESAVISSSRGLVVLLICILVLPRLFGMTGVWLAAPVTEAVTLLLSVRYISKDSKSCQLQAGMI